MSESCKVVFFGELQEGFDPEQVLGSFSEKFGVSLEKARKLLDAGKDVVLKGGLDEERARKYQKVLEKIGLVVRIDGLEPEPLALGLSLEPMGSTDDEATVEMDTSQIADSLNHCPKCGSSHVKDGECLDCGVIIKKFLTAENQAPEAEEEAWQAKSENPYSAPEADLVETAEGEMNGPQGVPAGHGASWLAGGWSYFKQNPVTWILAPVVWILLAMAVSLIPLLGGIVVNLLTPVVTAGFFIGCRAQDEGEDFSLSHLFAGFSTNTGQLILAGVIYFGVIILLGILMGFSFSMIGLQAMGAEDPDMLLSMMTSPGLLIGILLGFLLFIPVMMAYIFAPGLIALNDLKAIEAMKLSFSGCLKNMLPLTVYGLLAMILMIIGSLLLGLGLLVVMPILTASLYAAYRDIYYS